MTIEKDKIVDKTSHAYKTPAQLRIIANLADVYSSGVMVSACNMTASSLRRSVFDAEGATATTGNTGGGGGAAAGETGG